MPRLRTQLKSAKRARVSSAFECAVPPSQAASSELVTRVEEVLAAIDSARERTPSA
jgi:hypothetical protein